MLICRHDIELTLTQKKDHTLRTGNVGISDKLLQISNTLIKVANKLNLAPITSILKHSIQYYVEPNIFEPRLKLKPRPIFFSFGLGFNELLT